MKESFTNKEMLVRVMDQIDSLETKIDKVGDKLNKTNELAIATNGKVKLHTKLLFFLGGALISLAGLVIKSLIT